MDKVIEKKKGIARVFTIKALPYWFGVVVVGFISFLFVRGNRSSLRVNRDTLTIATVIEGEFNDYIRLNGQVQPMTTIQISPLEGGVVFGIVAPVEFGGRIG